MLSRISLVRHGESEGNIDEDKYLTIPDHRIRLTEEGLEQSLNAGTNYKGRMLTSRDSGANKIAIYVSPYRRAKQTYMQFRKGFGDAFEENFEAPKIDMRIREREWGDYQSYDREKVKAIKERFGSYFYRIPNGESGADAYDRVSDFLSTVFRHDHEQDHIMLFSHGDYIKAFVMRFFHKDYSWFEDNRVIGNAEIVTIEKVAGQWIANYNGEVLNTKGRSYELKC